MTTAAQRAAQRATLRNSRLEDARRKVAGLKASLDDTRAELAKAERELTRLERPRR